jgi:Xaa-Pro aminopeptidase
MLLQVDLGVRVDGYCADFQRMFTPSSHGEPPAGRSRAAVRGRILGHRPMIAGIAPGVPNDGVTRNAFQAITDLGFPEPKYGGGHQLGRAVHDGVLGF